MKQSVLVFTERSTLFLKSFFIFIMAVPNGEEQEKEWERSAEKEDWVYVYGSSGNYPRLWWVVLANGTLYCFSSRCASPLFKSKVIHGIQLKNIIRERSSCNEIKTGS